MSCVAIDQLCDQLTNEDGTINMAVRFPPLLLLTLVLLFHVS